MVADHLAPKYRPVVGGRPVFGIPAGTSALRKTVDCDIEIAYGTTITCSLPDVLGALVLKGAAYLEDSRDKQRHLDDAAILACALTTPRNDAARMSAHDRKRVCILAEQLSEKTHRSWSLLPAELRQTGCDSLALLSRPPMRFPEIQRLGDSGRDLQREI